MSEPTERPEPADSFFTPRKRPQAAEGTDRPASEGRPAAPPGTPPGTSGAPRDPGTNRDARAPRDTGGQARPDMPRTAGGPGRPDAPHRPQGPGAPSRPQGPEAANRPQAPGSGYRPQGPEADGRPPHGQGPGTADAPRRPQGPEARAQRPQTPPQRTPERPGAPERPRAAERPAPEARSGFSPDETMALRVPPPPGGRSGLPSQRRSSEATAAGRPQPGPQRTEQRTAERPSFEKPSFDRPAAAEDDWTERSTARSTVPRHEETLKLRVPDELAALAKAFDAQYARPPGAPDEETAEAAPEAKPARRGGGRDRYLDLLRALAIIRVVLYHLFGWAWMPLVFPSMGVMFALAGSLMARSLSRPALGVIRGRLRRLLPPMWLFGAIAITGMVLDGWRPTPHAETTWWADLAFWIVPFSDPPFAHSLHGFHGVLESTWGSPAVEPLWYLRAYLWFVLLSPLLRKAIHRFGWPAVLVPLAVSVTFALTGFDEGGRFWDVIVDITTYGSCWMLGMARQEGLMERIPRYVIPSVSPLVMVAGLWYFLSLPEEEPGIPLELDGVPTAQAVWSFGCVLLLLYLSPSWEQWPPRLERFNGFISLLNSRAVTIYLWHNITLTFAVGMIQKLWTVDLVVDNTPWLIDSDWFALTATVLLITLCVASFGWVEDLAAKRPLRLFPYPRRRPGGKRRAAV
ncbi:peptidoglycan/LPS O-acetylase OafA/YrhL [Streptomyces sp. TLI_235]|nr:acyltransferase family protein [Streptomyces sp. TLI_235]PBC77302.1 peptidoglycan/LPS O-acetylase OafA/YrhL [Streptomyces sp. TLI_235]